MKTRVINILEIALAIVFSIGYILTQTHISDVGWVAVVTSFLIGILYFPLGFYTLKSNNIQLGNSIFYGMLFSVAVVAIMFSLMKVNFAIILLIAMISIFLIIAFFRAFSIYLFTKWRILEYDNGIAIRYLILLIYMGHALYVYKAI